MSGSRWVIRPSMVIWVIKVFLYISSMYSCHLLLISYTSVGSICFCPLLCPSLQGNISMVSLIFLKWSLVFPILLLSSISLHCSLRKSFFSSPCCSLELWIQMSLSFLYSFPFCFSSFLSYLIFIWNHKKSSNSQGNLEKEKQSWRHHVSWFQAILQSYSHQNSMVLG